MAESRARHLHVSISRQNGPQCGEVGYTEAIEANMHKVPTHVHKDATGKFVERAWGPLSLCTHRIERPPRG